MISPEEGGNAKIMLEEEALSRLSTKLGTAQPQATPPAKKTATPQEKQEKKETPSGESQ